jgi:class 3 adenylate cyclase
MEQKQLVIILADISGYTRFMLETQTSAVHGQMIITGLIEAIIAQVDIPLTLQEIEGDAVFLYAARTGAHESEDAWRATVADVSRKLERFFHAFIARSAVMMEATPCPCAICRNSNQLGLKIIVHAGSAVFHSIAGRPQVSGPDVILAHRLLKNSIPGNEYLLLSENAYAAMGKYLGGAFVQLRETYDGFGTIDVRARLMDDELLAAREALYKLAPGQLDSELTAYTSVSNTKDVVRATMAQLRDPVRAFSWGERFGMVVMAFLAPIFLFFHARRAVPAAVKARGHARTEWGPAPQTYNISTEGTR